MTTQQQLMTAGEACSWAMDVWQPFGMAWQPAGQQPGQARLRVSGKSHDRNMLIDVTIGPRQRRVLELAMAVPIHPEAEKAAQVAGFVAFGLATITTATLAEADAWLAEALRGLRKDKPSRVIAQWQGWRVTLATTAQGILAVLVERGRP